MGNGNCWISEEIIIVTEFPIHCSLSGKSLQYSICEEKCRCKFCRGDQRELCWMTSELEPVTPEGSLGWTLGKAVICESVSWCLCNLHSWSAVLLLTRGQGLPPCSSQNIFAEKPRTKRSKSLYQTDLYRVGSGRQGLCTSHFSSRCSFRCTKNNDIAAYSNVTGFNLLKPLQHLSY